MSGGDEGGGLLPDDLRRTIPKRYEQEQVADPIAHAKFFTPWTGWTWWVLEIDEGDLCFGLVEGFEVELGYFDLEELESLRGPAGLKIERDLHFKPTSLSVIRAEIDGRDDRWTPVLPYPKTR